ncbi:MAG: hypothetical protein KDK78_00900 [Chlamydiia bacterium]|nr:hypothetical protein [Chlamydiia bacterium]
MGAFAPQAGLVHSHALETSTGTALRWAGPSLDKGPLPAVFYFFTTAEESLTLDPYNQVIQALHGLALRCYSLTVPLHSSQEDHGEAMQRWATAMMTDHDPLSPFLDDALGCIDYLIQTDLIDADHLAVAGLSRGAFVATHCMAREPRIAALLGFAPLTDPSLLPEFSSVQSKPVFQQMALQSCIPDLIGRKIRFYIGSRDERVGTERCFHFVHQLADQSYAARVRSAPVELIIGPSIGHKGHGTSPEVFKAGADWIRDELQVQGFMEWQVE